VSLSHETGATENAERDVARQSTCRRAERRLWFESGYPHRIAAPSWASKALCARRVATQKCEIAAVHERHTARNDTVDSLAQRCVFPLDRGDVTRFGVEQYGGDFAPARAFLFAIECADQECQPGTLRRRQQQAAEWWARSFAGEAPMQALKTVQPRTEIVIKWNQERASARVDILHEPDTMAALRTIKQNMEPVLGVSTLDDRR
jgi:hypothetical protein